MPIENERKFVLDPATPEETFSSVAENLKEIEQAYLLFGKKKSARIRRVLIDTESEYTFTFKQDVGRNTVEIETVISAEDYNLLKRGALFVFNKWRYDWNGWEVDFFKENGKNYFVQAEIELPVNLKKPESVPALIKQHLIYVVKKGDGRFSSKKLGCATYARQILQKLLARKV